MKIHKLQRRSGDAVVSAWPPQWASSYKGMDKFAIGDEGALESVKRLGDHLSLTMKYEGREHVGILRWDPPPTLHDVEKTLQAHLGQPIKAIGDLDI